MSQYKTVLAPNAPWPKIEPKAEQKPKGLKVKKLKKIDSFLNENRSKTSIALRKRDKLSGRLLPNDRVA